MELTNKQRLFVEEYLACWNATEAAKRAGYSPRTAYSKGSYVLHQPAVAERIKERIAEKAMSADEVLLRLADHARGSMEDFVEVGGGVDGFSLDLEKARDAGKLHLVKKLSSTENGPSIELYDAQSALVQLGKAHGLFVERTEMSGPNGEPMVVQVLRGVSMDEL